MSSSVLQRFKSPGKKEGSPKMKKGISASATSLLHWKSLLSSERKEKTSRCSQKKVIQTQKSAKPKKQCSKSRQRDTSIGVKEKGVNRSASKVFWDLLETVKSKQSKPQVQPLTISCRSLTGYHGLSKVAKTAREGRFSDKLCSDVFLGSFKRGLTDRNSSKIGSSILWSPKQQNNKSHSRRDRPGSSGLSSRIQDILQQHTVAKGRPNSKIENSLLSAVFTEDRIKQKQAKLSASSKLSLLGMKVDKLIKAVQQTNGLPDPQAKNNYLVFDRTPSRVKKLVARSASKESKKSNIPKKTSIMATFSDFNRCRPKTLPALNFISAQVSPKSSKVRISKKLWPSSMCLSKDISRFPEVQSFMRYPDKPDSLPMCGILHSMLPAFDYHRPAISEVSAVTTWTQKILVPSATGGIGSRGTVFGFDLIRENIPKMEWRASRQHNRKMVDYSGEQDSPNNDLKIIYDGFSIVERSNKLTEIKEGQDENGGSDTYNVESDNTRVLSPFQSPIGQMSEAKRKLIALRKHNQGQSQTPRIEGTRGLQSSNTDTMKFPSDYPLNDTSLRSLLVTKKTLMMPVLTTPEKPIARESTPVKETDDLETIGVTGKETPKFISSPKGQEKSQGLLASLSQLKSTIASKSPIN